MNINSSYLIYHPKRQISQIGQLTVHHDKFGGNEDPYLWNEQFLHTYCHITQLTNNIGQINFLISGDTFPDFNSLFCDCVFVIAEKCMWDEANHISRTDKIVDNDQSYEHHYKWGDKKQGHHQLNKRSRYTLKADSKNSFQPQDGNGNLIDILPFLNSQGLTTDALREGMKAGVGSRPFELGKLIGGRLYEYLMETATVKLTGNQIADRHPHWSKGTVPINNSCC